MDSFSSPIALNLNKNTGQHRGGCFGMICVIAIPGPIQEIYQQSQLHNL